MAIAQHAQLMEQGGVVDLVSGILRVLVSEHEAVPAGEVADVGDVDECGTVPTGAQIRGISEGSAGLIRLDLHGRL
jgi:hypothetical protein